jgi:hypothetical protein
MGNNPNETLYAHHSMEEFAHKDSQPFIYLWIDLNVSSKENNAYLITFKKTCMVEAYEDVEMFKKRIDEAREQRRPVRAMCSASLDDKVYDFIQRHEAVERAMLFCANRTKAGILTRNFPKIKQACFGYS